ncbi:hypothetical protein PAERUG_P54_1_London_24_VIM_2_04_13_02058 [Pseudomonas aeruginosa]|nr:hypothetical protein PAERUG_P54_1_London_24_VIM_2_04_13_02058 [Pseudomonas aeruginosa]
MGEGANLVGDHGETAALLAGASRLDGRVERQEIGLFGDTADHVEDLGNVLGLFRQAADQRRGIVHFFAHQADRLDRLQYPLASVLRRLLGGGRGVRGGAGVARHFLDGGGHLVDRGGGHLDFVVLLGQRAVALLGDGAEFLRGGGQLGRRAADLLDGLAQLCLHALEGDQQLGRFVAARGVDAAGEVAGSDHLGHSQRLADRLGDAAGEQPGQYHGSEAGDQQYADHCGEGAVIDLIGRVAGLAGALDVEVDQRLQLLLGGAVLVEQGAFGVLAGLFQRLAARHLHQGLLALQERLPGSQVALVDRALVGTTDQPLVGALAIGQFLADFRHAAFQEALAAIVRRQHMGQLHLPQFGEQNVQLGAFADARQPVVADVRRGFVERTHPVQGKDAGDDQQSGDQGETQGGTGRDGHTAQRHDGGFQGAGRGTGLTSTIGRQGGRFSPFMQSG